MADKIGWTAPALVKMDGDANIIPLTFRRSAILAKLIADKGYDPATMRSFARHGELGRLVHELLR